MPKTADSFDEEPDGSETYPDDDVYADEAGTLPCPYCGEDVSELAELCPHCKSYISFEDAPARSKPRWFVVTAIVLLLVSTGAVALLFHR